MPPHTNQKPKAAFGDLRLMLNMRKSEICSTKNADIHSAVTLPSQTDLTALVQSVPRPRDPPEVFRDNEAEDGRHNRNGRCRRKVAEESDSEEPPSEMLHTVSHEPQNTDSAHAVSPTAQQNKAEESDGSDELTASRPTRRRVAAESDSEDMLAKPADGIWQIVLDTEKVWGEAHVKFGDSYLQQAGLRQRTPLSIDGDGSKDSPFRIGAANLVESEPGVCVWQWPDGRRSTWTQVTSQSRSSRKKRKRRERCGECEFADGSTMLTSAGKANRKASLKQKRRDSGRMRHRKSSKRKRKRNILDASWEKWLASIRPKSPSPLRPLGPLAESDGESSAGNGQAGDDEPCHETASTSQQESSATDSEEDTASSKSSRGFDDFDEKRMKRVRKSDDFDDFSTSCSRLLRCSRKG